MTAAEWKDSLFYAMLQGYGILFGVLMGTILGKKFPRGPWRRERSR